MCVCVCACMHAYGVRVIVLECMLACECMRVCVCVTYRANHSDIIIDNIQRNQPIF